MSGPSQIVICVVSHWELNGHVKASQHYVCLSQAISRLEHAWDLHGPAHTGPVRDLTGLDWEPGTWLIDAY